MTTLDELLAMMSRRDEKAAATDGADADTDSLDDGPVLTWRLWPAGLPRPEARRRPPPEPPPPVLLEVRETQPVAVRTARQRRPSRLARGLHAIILLTLGGAAFALVTDVGRRTAPPVPAATAAIAVGAPRRIPAPAASPVAPREPARTDPVEDTAEVLPDDQLPGDELPGDEPPLEAVAAPTGSTLLPARLPIRPSNSEIANAIVDAQVHLERCRDAFATSGLVPIEIEVAPSGAITSVSVGLGSTGFRTCIRDSLLRQRLPASTQGTTARFPIVVR